MRDTMPANVKLAGTIRFLSTGASYTDLQYAFRIQQSTFSKFIPEVWEIYNNMKTQYLKVCFSLFSKKYTSHSYTLDYANLKYLIYQNLISYFQRPSEIGGFVLALDFDGQMQYQHCRENLMALLVWNLVNGKLELYVLFCKCAQKLH